MSKYGVSPFQETYGILPTEAELISFSDKLGLKWFKDNHFGNGKDTYIDAVMPLPGVSFEEQLKLLADCPIDHEDDFDNSSYWERENGSHGWCCSKCGKVFQWG